MLGRAAQQRHLGRHGLTQQQPTSVALCITCAFWVETCLTIKQHSSAYNFATPALYFPLFL